jgi:hypothetical protein
VWFEYERARQPCQLLQTSGRENMQDVNSQSSKEEWKAWESELANRIVDSINAVRNARDMTVKVLSERLEYFGWPVGLATLNGILSAKKRASFSAAELMTFGRALNVSPTYLMLGLPFASELPEGRLLGEQKGLVEVFAWMTGKGNMEPHPDDTLVRDVENMAYVVDAISRHSLSDLAEYHHSMNMLLWQNSLLQVLPKFDPEVMAKILPPYLLNGDAFFDGVNGVSSIRDSNRKLEYWGVQFPALPPQLQFLDDAEVVEFEPPIVGLNSPDELERARAFLQDKLDEFGSRGSRIGAPTNTAE